MADQHDRDLISTALDDTLIVEAAAGTGKTTELVHRIVRVIETGRAEVTEIVSVTFTEKAAGELKLRLREALEESRSAAAAGSKERERLDEARFAGSKKRKSARSTASAPTCCANVRSRRASIRCLPCSPRRRPRRLYDAAFQTWFQEQLSNPPEGIQRSLRRPSFAGFGPGARATRTVRSSGCGMPAGS